MYLAYNSVAVEKLGKPAVMLVNRAFVNDARTGASVREVPGLRLVPTTIPCEVGADNLEAIRAGVSEIVDDLILAMTRPLTAEEKSPKPKEVQKPSRIIFKGNLEEVNRFFYKRGWSYGLPIIPPTEEAVREMLTGTDLPAEHVVAKLPPRLGKATVEKIAINAVMAGALPTYMPVLIAAVQAMVDPKIKVEGHLCSVWAGPPFWVINGPIRHDLHVNSGLTLLNPENIANASIGSAMGHIIRNIAGSRPGIESMSAFGHEGKYTMCIAENEEESPWEPLHVEHGLNKEDSAVTVFFTNARSMLHSRELNAEGVLRSILYGIIGDGGLIMSPGAAKLLAEKGWTKKGIASWLAEYARVPGYAHPYFARGAAEFFMPKERAPLDTTFSVPLLTPEATKIVVAGGTPEICHSVSYSGVGAYGGWVTKKVELPANWDKLVKKYKDIVPTYARY